MSTPGETFPGNQTRSVRNPTCCYILNHPIYHRCIFLSPHSGLPVLELKHQHQLREIDTAACRGKDSELRRQTREHIIHLYLTAVNAVAGLSSFRQTADSGLLRLLDSHSWNNPHPHQESFSFMLQLNV